MPLQPPKDVQYSLDADDCITSVNQAWTDFALANGGEALTPPAILRQSIWDFVSDETTRDLYRRLFDRVRAGAGPVTFSLRCDSPTTRRLLEMSVVAGHAGAIDISARAVSVEPRQAVSISGAAPSSEILRSCGWCNRMPDGEGHWMEIEDALAARRLMEMPQLPLISHGICDDCMQRMLATIAGPPAVRRNV